MKKVKKMKLQKLIYDKCLKFILLKGRKYNQVILVMNYDHMKVVMITRQKLLYEINSKNANTYYERCKYIYEFCQSFLLANSYKTTDKVKRERSFLLSERQLTKLSDFFLVKNDKEDIYYHQLYDFFENCGNDKEVSLNDIRIFKKLYETMNDKFSSGENFCI